MSGLFYWSYPGNKRTEVKHIAPIILDMAVKTVVEPFGGTCAVSRAMADTHAVYVSDYDPGLTTFCNLFHTDAENICQRANDYLKREWTRELYIAEQQRLGGIVPTRDNIHEFFALKRYRQSIAPGRPPMRGGVIFMPANIMPKKYEALNEFYRGNTYHNEPYTVAFDKFRDDPTACIFLDPPYVSTCNDSYYKDESPQDMWEDIIDLFEHSRCGVLLAVKEDIWMKIAFKNWQVQKYDKTYQISKKTVSHVLYAKRPDIK